MKVPDHQHTHEAAQRLGQIAVGYWEGKGAIGVGFLVHPISANASAKSAATLWTYSLTGIDPRTGMPLHWRDGMRPKAPPAKPRRYA